MIMHICRQFKNLPTMSVGFTLVSVGFLSTLGCTRQKEQPKTETPKIVLNVKDFGARGDGKTDDYEALQAAASALCKSPDATLLFPEGTYRIDRYRISGGPKVNTVQDIRYVGCKGNTISGVKARIDVNGSFRRTADKKSDASSSSYADSVVPFEMVQSSGFRIIGFDIEGNADRMSRDPNVAMGGAAGILTVKCRDYYIEDVTIKEFSGDGIRIGDDSQSSDEGAHLVNVTANNNARQGLEIINVRGGDIVNSVFSNNGRPGAYGAHLPAAGVAIDPIRYSSDTDPTGSLTFDKCRFEENVGPQFFSGRPDLVESLTIRNSYISSTLPDTNATTSMSDAKVALIQGNTFHVAGGHGVALAGYSPVLYNSINRVTYSKNTFDLGDNKGLVAPLQSAPVELVGNTIHVGSHTKDLTLLRLDYLKLAENNLIFEANSGYSDVHPTVLFEKGNETVRNNMYETDRTEPGYFDVYYGPDAVTSGEVYRSPANFRRYYSTTAK